MDIFQARLDSFSKSKRTKQSLSKSTSTGALKWPHPSTYKATPRTLADAGFYYNPSPDYRDSVTCFMCRKELSDWDADDDPFEIHWEKCRNTCAWAIARCGLVIDLDERGNYNFSDPMRLPTSKIMEKARLETFTAKKQWPHDTVKGHGASSKKMAKAGFVYTPQSPGDDTATCLYCDLSLSGWDDDDDPTTEHLKREKKSGPPCAFFHATTTKSSNSVRPADSDDELVMPHMSRDEGTTRTRAQSSGSRVSTAVAKTPGSKRSIKGEGMTGKTPASRATAGSEVDDSENASESDAGKKVSKTKRKGKVQSKAQIQVIHEEEELDQADEDQETIAEAEVIAVKEKPKRGRPPKVNKPAIPTESPPEGTDIDSMPVKKAHTRTRSRANVESDTDLSKPSSSKPTHFRTKSSSKAKEKEKGKATEEEAPETRSTAPSTKSGKKSRAREDSEPPSDVPPLLTAKPKARGVKVSRSKSKKMVDLKSDVEAGAGSPDDQHEQPSKAAGAASKAKGEALVPKAHAHDAKDGVGQRRGRASSVSDDAGYATADPMQLDDTVQQAGMPNATEPQAKSLSATRSSTAVAAARKDKPPQVSKALRDADRDVVVASHTPSVATEGGSTPSDIGSAGGTEPPRSSSMSKLTSSSRTGSSGTDRSSSSGQRVKEKMNVVEIPSDGEVDSGIRGATAGVATGRASTQAEPLKVKGAMVSASKKGKKKLQVEVVIPPKMKKVDPLESPPNAEKPTVVDLPMEVEGAAESSSGGDAAGPSPSTPPRSTAFSVPAPVSPDAGVPDVDNADVPSDADAEAFPASYTPLMAALPIQKLDSLTDEEMDMTVEQYIRRETEIQYHQLRMDAERRISQLREKAAETRRVIEAL